MEFQEDAPVQLPINGILDLHPFSPRDIKTLIPDYIEECILRKIHQIRIIHGKGTGNLQRSVHALLSRNPHVTHYRLADNSSGGWGATIVDLRSEVADEPCR